MRTLALMLAMNVGAAAASNGEFAPLTVRVNGVEQGVQLVRVDADQPCLSPAQLLALGTPESALPQQHRRAEVEVVPLTEAQETSQECLHNAQLAPHIALVLDTGAARLDVRIDPKLLAAQTVNATDTRVQLPAQYPRSAYLNYGLDLAHSGAGDRVEAQAPLEWVGRWNRWLADTTLIAREGSVQRLFSSVQRDFPERLAALRIGDVAAGGSATAGAALLGVQFARETMYEPLRRRTPGLDFAGVLDTPSTVEVYVDERLVSRSNLPAGPFTLQELPVPSGTAGTVRVEIVDAFGNRRTVEQPFFLGSGLLARGESEFNYNLGLPRVAGAGNQYSRQPALVFAHRWGLRDALTAGYEGLAAEDTAVLGARTDFGLGRAGEIGLSYVAGGVHSAPGQQASAAYRYSNGPLNVGADYTQRSAAFRTLTPSLTGAQRRWRLRVGTQLPGGYSATLGYARSQSDRATQTRDAQIHTRDTLYSAGLNGRIGRTASFNLQAQWDPQRSEPGLLLLFTRAGRSGNLAQLSLADDDGQREAAARYSSSLRNYTGGAYRLDYRHRDSDEADSTQAWGGEYEWRATQYTARVLHQQSGETDQSRLMLAGSVALSADGYGFGQPIRGSFVAVDLAQFRGAEIYADGRLIGRSGKRPVMVVDLAPYLAHSLRLRLDSGMPIGIDLPASEQQLALAERSGLWLKFTTRRLRLYEGTVLRGDGQPVQFTPVTVTRDGVIAAETVTGENGYLYLEHLEPGDYEFQVGGSRPCRFQANLPDAEDTVIALGAQTCGAMLTVQTQVLAP